MGENISFMRKGQHGFKQQIFLPEWAVFVMKTSLRRSVSCNYSYDPVAASDTDDSVIDERQEPTLKKRPRTQRAVSDPGVNNPETNDSPLTTPMAEKYELQPNGQDDPQQVHIHNFIYM